MPSELKQMQVAELEKRIGSASSLVIVGLAGLKGQASLDVRRRARENGAKLFLMKNNLASLVFAKKGWTGLEKSLEGPTAVLLGKDAVATAKLARDLAKDFKEKVIVRAGVYDGAVYSAEQVLQLATMPSREELFAKFLGMLCAPANGLLSTVHSPVGNLLNILEQMRESKSESESKAA
ncbi:MAG: 50S ribosomal protein L10 [Candidatus Brocadiia bacterium]